MKESSNEEPLTLTRHRGPDGQEWVRSNSPRFVDGQIGYDFGDGVCLRSPAVSSRVLRAARRAAYDAEQIVLGL